VNATFYIADPSLIDSKVFKRFPDVKKMESAGTKRRATGFVLATRWGKITFTFMAAKKFSAHLQQFENFLRRALPNAEEQLHAVNRLAYVRLCMSCLFDVRAGSEAEVTRFLVKLNRKLNGVLVMPTVIFDHDGTKLWKMK
jgi:predicted small metal-binding protein